MTAVVVIVIVLIVLYAIYRCARQPKDPEPDTFNAQYEAAKAADVEQLVPAAKTKKFKWRRGKNPKSHQRGY